MLSWMTAVPSEAKALSSCVSTLLSVALMAPIWLTSTSTTTISVKLMISESTIAMFLIAFQIRWRRDMASSLQGGKSRRILESPPREDDHRRPVQRDDAEDLPDEHGQHREDDQRAQLLGRARIVDAGRDDDSRTDGEEREQRRDQHHAHQPH